MVPPNTLVAPSVVRVSAITTASPLASSMAMTGSMLEMASSSPLRTAATAPGPAPTPMKEASSGLSPALTIRNWAIMLVEEPGAVTPMRAPLRSAMDLILSHAVLLAPPA